MSLADGMAEAAELAEDGLNAEPAKSAEELLVFALSALCVVTASGADWAVLACMSEQPARRRLTRVSAPEFCGQKADRWIACLCPQRSAASRCVDGFRNRERVMNAVVPCILVLATLVSSSSGCVRRGPFRVGFWYETDALALPTPVAVRLGSPLETDEASMIEQISRAEISRAFSELNIRLTTSRDAFWRVTVVSSWPAGAARQPSAGESFSLGLLGGRGAVGVDMVASKATLYAPLDASRKTLIEGIGRGIGRVAVHEFFHQILGLEASHNDGDPGSYEYGSPDRQAQYYGELHWSTAESLLRRKVGR
jgi:hypothetical protein